jgi:hypothetical protein
MRSVETLPSINSLDFQAVFRKSSTSVEESICMAILNGVGRTSIDPGDLNTFDIPPKQTVITGPTRLYRFGRPKLRGKWWFDQSLFSTLKEDFYDSVYGDLPRQKDEDGTRYLRYSLAVSREWNKFAWVWVLTLKAGEELDCFVGPTSPQPEWRNQPDSPLLAGGMPQYVIYEIDMVPQQNFSEISMMSLWQKWS